MFSNYYNWPNNLFLWLLKLATVKGTTNCLKMLHHVAAFLFFTVSVLSEDQSASIDFNYLNLKDDIYDQQAQFMSPKKNPHEKASVETTTTEDPWTPFDFSKFDAYLAKTQDGADNNRIKRHAKRHHIHGRRRNKLKNGVAADAFKNITTTSVPIARKGDATQRKPWKNRKSNYDSETNPSSFMEMPKDLYQAHLRPGVIFRIHMSEAILKMQYRNYAEDKDESVIEADVEYLRLTRKVISDEITKFEDLNWLMGWFENRSNLIHEHTCNTRYYTVGTPPTKFSGPEEYMKRACLFDSVYVDQMPYVVGEDGSLLAAVAPPVLHCDAATCTSVPFIDSLMFEEQYGLTNVRTITRCQASCRAHCKNDADCLKRCSDRCLRTE